MMASDDKTVKTNPVAKNEASAETKKEASVETKSSSGADPSKAEGSKVEGGKAEGGKAEGGKAEGGETAAASPSGYHRGEGQKPVSQAYRDNWNVIFAKKKKR
jgi:hypothetical protein